MDSQLAAIIRYADERGFRHSQALTYADEGHSGTWIDRPALDGLRDHAREGCFDVVVVLCPNRLARNLPRLNGPSHPPSLWSRR